MQIFYVPHIDGQKITLSEDESKHCVRVLRLGTGDSIRIVDGKGNLFNCKIAEDNPKRCTVRIESVIKDFEKRPFRLHIAIAPTKNMDRLEWFVEKATEIGIDEITPLLCEHSERKVVNLERLERVMISAMKQSGKAMLPKLNPATPFESVLKNADEKVKLIAYCGDLATAHAREFIGKGESVIFLIGPEGDFSPMEIQAAIENHFNAVSLGSSRLRTETAGVVACTMANLINE